MEIEAFGEVCRIEPAEKLPLGWKWHQWTDGSGGLYDAEGKSRYSYDLTTNATYWGAIEYRNDRKGEWNWFYGTFKEFKEFAENSALQEMQQPKIRSGLCLG